MMRVLVAVGCVDEAATLGTLVAAWGYDPRVVHEAVSALEVAAEFLPDVVLLSVSLPGPFGGYETARRIRAQPGMLDAALVALTSPHESRDYQQAHEAGFALYLPRPVDPDELRQLLYCCEQAFPARRSRRGNPTHPPQTEGRGPHGGGVPPPHTQRPAGRPSPGWTDGNRQDG